MRRWLILVLLLVPRPAAADAAAILADAQMKASGDNPAAATAVFLAARTQFPDHKGIFLAATGHCQRFGTESETLALLAEGLSKYADEPPFLSFVAAMRLAPDSLAPFRQALDDARRLLTMVEVFAQRWARAKEGCR